jgi:chromosome segregation ATPase
MNPATEARLDQLQIVLRIIRQIAAIQFHELDRDAQEAFLAATGELERALKSHDPYAVAVAVDAVEELVIKKQLTMPNDGANRRNRLLEKSRDQLRAALRSTDEVIEQLQAQLRTERARYAAELAEAKAELTKVRYELAELRYQIAGFRRRAISVLNDALNVQRSKFCRPCGK